MKLILALVALSTIPSLSKAETPNLTMDEAKLLGTQMAISGKLDEYKEFGMLSVVAVNCIDSRSSPLSADGVAMGTMFVGMTNIRMLEDGIRIVDHEKANQYLAGVSMGLDLFFGASSDEQGCALAKVLVPKFFVE